MSTKRDQFSSPPCFAHEIEKPGVSSDDYDEDCWRDVQRWRVSKRKQLIHLRKQLLKNQRTRETLTITNKLDRLLVVKTPAIVGVYWPINSEMNLLDWCQIKTGAGIQFCLPVIGERNQSMAFCQWNPGEPVISGEWGIPAPLEKIPVEPDLIIVPLLGADAEKHRLGYGGGYYDRTLAIINEKVFTVGVGFSSAIIPTIYPQPHDISLSATILG